MATEIAANYFKTLNPLAERISEDIENIRNAYESLWDNLAQNEKEKIIDETIVHPEALLKYSLSFKEIYGNSGCFLETGSKVITDDLTGHSWLDEHSAPFSWKSRSLLQLCTSPHCVPAIPVKALFNSMENNKGSEKEDRDEPDAELSSKPDVGATFSTICARIKSLPSRSYDYSCQLTHSIDDRNILSRFKKGAVEKLQNTFKIMGGRIGGSGGIENDVLVVKGGAVIVPRADKNILAKPQTPPPPPPRVLFKKQLEDSVPDSESKLLAESDQTVETMSHCSDDHDVSVNLVPKSGFDFLDNW